MGVPLYEPHGVGGDEHFVEGAVAVQGLDELHVMMVEVEAGEVRRIGGV